MADTKISDLPAVSAGSLNSLDLVPLVINTAGTPASRKITVQSLLSADIKRTQSAALSTDHSHTSRDVFQFTAAATQNFGDVCYIDSNGKMALIDADAAASSLIAAMCVSASSVAADSTGDYIIGEAIVRDDSWNWTVGGVIYASVTGTTGNTLTQTAPYGDDDVVVPVGIATHADRMIFRPSLSIAVVSA